MIADRIASLAEVAEAARESNDLSLPLRDFLDGFYPEPKPDSLATVFERHQKGFESRTIFD